MSTLLPRRAVLSALAGFGLGACDCGKSLTVYLVRHAEKAHTDPESKDPPLSDEGARRARGLVKALDGVKLDAVYASQFKRTQLTVMPAAEARSMQVEALDAGDTPAVVAKIRSHTGAVLVAGHSNTVPEIATALGVKEKLALGEDDYGDLFVIEVSGGSATLQRRRFEPV